MIANFQGRSLKIQPQLAFEFNGFKNSMRKYFENSLKSFKIFQILMGGMNFKEKSQKTKRPQQCSEECTACKFFSQPCILLLFTYLVYFMYNLFLKNWDMYRHVDDLKFICLEWVHWNAKYCFEGDKNWLDVLLAYSIVLLRDFKRFTGSYCTFLHLFFSDKIDAIHII